MEFVNAPRIYGNIYKYTILENIKHGVQGKRSTHSR
jgi:hypothetical protein